MIKTSLLFLLLSATKICAQPIVSDTTFVSSAIESNKKLYEKFIGGQEMYYSGSAYSEPLQTNDDHPFFLSEDWTTGSVTLSGERFDNVPLLYDLTSDQVITESLFSNMIVIIKEKLEKFTMGGNTFERVDNTFKNSLPRTGYYQVLHDGPSRVLCLREKSAQEDISSRTLETYFDVRNRYFIYKDGLFYSVKGKASVLKLFSDRKGEVRSHISKSRLNFTTDRDKALASAAKFYDSITEQVR